MKAADEFISGTPFAHFTGAEPGLEGEQTPCILHLDSMSGR